MLTSLHSRAQSTFHPAPSLEGRSTTRFTTAPSIPADADVIGVFVDPNASSPELLDKLGVDREALLSAGFEGKAGQVLVVPRSKGPPVVAIGVGDRGQLDLGKLRDAAAAFARAAHTKTRLALLLPDTGGVPSGLAAQALAEGILLSRYRYLAYQRPAQNGRAIESLTFVKDGVDLDEAQQGLERGRVASGVTWLARDLANAPASLLTATRLGELAETLAQGSGLQVELFDGEALAKLGCGGLLGVNAGSAEPPRMIKLTYQPRDARGQAIDPIGHLALVGKGIMFDAGGLGLKPNDLVHATMKGDMSGAGAILAAMTALSSIGCRSAVTGYLMCTDNMPSGTAMKLGDVLTVRGGKTVEVINTDAEGRLVMADALVLATEQTPRPDAIVDIATLTGACQRALGVRTAGVFGNNQALVEQVKAAGERTGETVWQLPLDKSYRPELESEIAYMKNVGGENAGAITAALFLEEFVAGVPWAHIDMAGTARVERDETWRTKGASGYGARLLLELIAAFTPPAQTRH